MTRTDIEAEILYLVNIEESNYREILTERSFYNYLYVSGNSLTLLGRDGILTTCNYDSFPRVISTKQMNTSMKGLVCNYNNRFLCHNSNNILTYDQQIIASPQDGFKFKVFKKDILCFSETAVYLYNGVKWIEFFVAPEEQTIRECSIDQTRIYILTLYERGDARKSALYYFIKR